MKYRYAAIYAALLGLSGNCAYGAEDRLTTTWKFDDWSVMCVEKDNVRACEARTFVSDKDGVPLVKLAVVRDSDKEMVFEVMVPLVTDLKKGIQFGVHGKHVNYVTRLPYSYCVPAGCIAKADLGGLLGKLKIGKEIHVSYSSVLQGEVRSTSSLMGFSDAYRSLTQ